RRDVADVAGREGVGRWPAGAVDQQHPLAVDDGAVAENAAHAAGERLDVHDAGRHGGGEAAGGVGGEGAAPRGEAHSALVESIGAVAPAKARTMQSTVNDATSAPSSSCTRHSAWVMPSPANVDSWWYSSHLSARTSRWIERLMALTAV